MVARNRNVVGFVLVDVVSIALSCALSWALPCALSGLVAGCIGVSQKRAAAGGVVGGSVADLTVCRTGLRPADDGAIDDFEDGNSQVNLEGGREGYWWTAKDEKGSSIGPAPFVPAEGGGSGSELSLHVEGDTVPGDTANGFWGAEFGFNFLGKGPYDASKYVGIAFKARIGGGTARSVRFNVGDINTHLNGGICKTCWNHFGKVVALTPEWKEYRILFSDLRQEDYWGNPRPPAITPGQLFNGEFKIGPGQHFDVWVDDLHLLACK